MIKKKEDISTTNILLSLIITIIIPELLFLLWLIINFSGIEDLIIYPFFINLLGSEKYWNINNALFHNETLKLIILIMKIIITTYFFLYTLIKKDKLEESLIISNTIISLISIVNALGWISDDTPNLLLLILILPISILYFYLLRKKIKNNL